MRDLLEMKVKQTRMEEATEKEKEDGLRNGYGAHEDPRAVGSSASHDILQEVTMLSSSFRWDFEFLEPSIAADLP